MKPSRAQPLPKQLGREAEQHREALDGLRREMNARPTPLRFPWTREADGSAGATSTDLVYASGSRLSIEAVEAACETTAAPDASHYATLTLQAFNVDGDQTTRKLASFTTAETGFTAYRPRAFTLERTDVPAGWVVRLLVTKTGSGVQLGRLHLFVSAEAHHR